MDDDITKGKALDHWAAAPMSRLGYLIEHLRPAAVESVVLCEHHLG
jgi:hypothetical protein